MSFTNFSYLKGFLLLCCYNLSFAQQLPLSLQLKGEPINQPKFYITSVIDERKDTLNNGSAGYVGSKKIPLRYENGAAYQLQQFFDFILPGKDSSMLMVVAKIIKLQNTVRKTSKTEIARTELTLRFYRNDNEKLHELYELNTFQEEGNSKRVTELLEKNLREIVQRMAWQFNDQIIKHPDNPLFASRIIFKIVNHTNSSSESDTLNYTTARKLSWDDFKGKPDGSVFAALSNCAFSQQVTTSIENGIGIIYINIRAVFLKKGSWVKNDKATDDVLKHEQLHFDIAEWRIREMRKELINAWLTLKNYDALITKIYNDAWLAYNKIQAAYDDETMHGLKTEEQQRWNEKVANMLSQLKPYE